MAISKRENPARFQSQQQHYPESYQRCGNGSGTPGRAPLGPTLRTHTTGAVRCRSVQVPLYILLVSYHDGYQPQLLGAGAAKLRIDLPGNGTPGEQHLVALYDPFGLPVAHARCEVQLSNHGTSMHPHLLRPSRPAHRQKEKGSGQLQQCKPSSKQLHAPAKSLNSHASLDLACSPASLHVHCHVHSPSPPPPAASVSRARKSPPRKKPSKASQRQSKARPMSTPQRQRGCPSPPGIPRVYPLSAPSTPAKPPHVRTSRGCSVQPRLATAATQAPSQRHSSNTSSIQHRCSDASLVSKASQQSRRTSRGSKKIKAARRHAIAAQLYQQRLEEHVQVEPREPLQVHVSADEVQCHDVAAIQQPTALHQPPPSPHRHQGAGVLQSCTMCQGANTFKPAGTEQIAAVACEMMTLVSMRAAMSQVMDGLVHQWQAGFKQTLPPHTQPVAAAAAPVPPPPGCSCNGSPAHMAHVPQAPPQGPPPQGPPPAPLQARPLAPQSRPPVCRSPQPVWASPQGAGAAARSTTDGVPPAAAAGGPREPPRPVRSTAPAAPAVWHRDSGAELVAVELAPRPHNAAHPVFEAGAVRTRTPAATSSTGSAATAGGRASGVLDAGSTVAEVRPAVQCDEWIDRHVEARSPCWDGPGRGHSEAAEAVDARLEQHPRVDRLEALPAPEEQGTSAVGSAVALRVGTSRAAACPGSCGRRTGSPRAGDGCALDCKADVECDAAARVSAATWPGGQTCPAPDTAHLEARADGEAGLPGRSNATNGSPGQVGSLDVGVPAGG